ncbi:MAG: MmcQ/YjbR family DNA-binding protein [Actinomycetota bacterium]|nr:MmcQ/YjbR family DNA-binding protein [Actinomycetota bacterium]
MASSGNDSDDQGMQVTRHFKTTSDTVRQAALALKCALESYPFGPAMTVFRLFNDSGPVFAMLNEDGDHLFVRVSEEIHEAAEGIEGMDPKKFWKNWVSLDLAVHKDPGDITAYINESWIEVAERRPVADQKRLGLHS